MFDQHFLSPVDAADVFGPLQGGERVMWRGRCGVAEYAFDEAASLPRWTLPETTDVLVTDHRVLYAYTAEDGRQVRSGELRWLWPQHLRVQPGARSTDRGAAATQIQLVCGGADGTYPALVFAGGDLATVGDADRLANVVRQAIARFRVDNVAKLGLTASQGRMLSRLLIGPEFRNHQGGDGQTVSLLGALLVSRPVPRPEVDIEPLEAETLDVEPLSADAVAENLLDDSFLLFPADEELPAGALARREDRPVAEGTRLITYRPGRAADAARALMAAKAEAATQQSEPATASRAAELAARIASLVSGSTEPAPTEPVHTEPVHTEPVRADPVQDQHPEPESFQPQDPQQFQSRLEDRPTDDHRSFGARLTDMRSADAGRPEEIGSAGHEAWSRGPWQAGPPRTGARHSEPRHSEAEDFDIRHIERAAAERLAAERAAAAERYAAERAAAEMPTTNLAQRAESMRRAAARMAANAARGRVSERRGDREPGISSRGNRNG